MKSTFKPRAKPHVPAPPPAAVLEIPALPLASERGKPLWPRTEDDLDLPTFPPPPPPALDAPIYLGSVRARLYHAPDPLDLEVRLAVDGSAVEIGPLMLDPATARRLWRLLRIAVAVLGCGYPAPEEVRPHG